METNSPDSQYHPDFMDCPSGTDVGVTLVSREKTLFRVNANVLKAASRVFETTLSLPQSEGNASSDPVIDNLDEGATTIEGLLRMITGREFPPLDTIENVESLLLAANKWEMPGPLSILKMVLLRDTSFAEKHPIRLYWLGCRLKWVALVQLAARFSCNDDVYYHQVLDSVLETMDPGDLLRLVRFHRKRRDAMRNYLVGSSFREGCFSTRANITPNIKALCMVFFEFMDRNPPAKPLMDGALRNLVTQCKLEEFERVKANGDGLGSVVSTLMIQWRNLPQDISTS
jgi:BTB/POZ domain